MTQGRRQSFLYRSLLVTALLWSPTPVAAQLYEDAIPPRKSANTTTLMIPVSFIEAASRCAIPLGSMAKPSLSRSSGSMPGTTSAR